ncbi:UbiX family flavin prenyltransferase [Ampullimonas aquatilis]|uniref:UbiX family flavin prenyltransferase n=1 Tax=Ampullimonas aquatilis TaxID=1341549 RepID=UPI003C71300B
MIPTSSPIKIIVAITGASGAIYGVRLLKALRGLPTVETHLLISSAGLLNLKHETNMGRDDIRQLADIHYTAKDIGAAIASGSFATHAMVVAPCSMKTLASIAHGMSDNLISRAADVTLKERRRLILMVRETPFNLAHLRNMTAVTEMGGIIFPPVPGFYQRPQSIEAMVDHTIGRVMDLMGLAQSLSPAWQGLTNSTTNDYD